MARQTTCRRRARAIVPLRDDALDLELLAPDAVRFVPVELRRAGRAIFKPDPSDPFSLTPASSPVEFPKSRKLANAASAGDCFFRQTKPGLVTIAGKPGDDLAPGTLNSVLRQAGLKT